MAKQLGLGARRRTGETSSAAPAPAADAKPGRGRRKAAAE